MVSTRLLSKHPKFPRLKYSILVTSTFTLIVHKKRKIVNSRKWHKTRVTIYWIRQWRRTVCRNARSNRPGARSPLYFARSTPPICSPKSKTIQIPLSFNKSSRLCVTPPSRNASLSRSVFQFLASRAPCVPPDSLGTRVRHKKAKSRGNDYNARYSSGQNILFSSRFSIPVT
jgi:hypothetical protein